MIPHGTGSNARRSLDVAQALVAADRVHDIRRGKRGRELAAVAWSASERSQQRERAADGLERDGECRLEGPVTFMEREHENGVTSVLGEGGKPLATNEVTRGYTLSSLAVAGSRLLLRTGTQLYCIGN